MATPRKRDLAAASNLQFRRRAQIRETDVATRRRYTSLCGRYCVEHARAKLAGDTDRWQAFKRTDALSLGFGGREQWEFVARRCRCRRTAEAACRRAARQSSLSS